MGAPSSGPIFGCQCTCPGTVEAGRGWPRRLAADNCPPAPVTATFFEDKESSLDSMRIVANDGFTVWLTGLPGAGKTTLARALRDEVCRRGRRVEILDGDEIRTTLSANLGFSKTDRDTNVRRIGFVARLLSRNGIVAIAALVSPYRDTRKEVRSAQEAPFVEVY